MPVFGSQDLADGAGDIEPADGHMEADQYSDELQLLGSAFDDSLEWIVGAYWMRMEGSQTLP